jgi:hypothetical protein
MKPLQRNCLLRSRIILLIFLPLFGHAQSQGISNYVSNGGFELSLPIATLNPFDAVKNWSAIDSTQSSSYYLYSITLGNAPYASTGFQYPRSGNNYILTSFYCNNCQRWYPSSRLKQTLTPNTKYCAKYYVVNTNNTRIAIENYQIYFGDNSLDTITLCNVPLTYLNPQVTNSSGIITDTLAWIPITGTFVAVGNEKYVVLGNFKSNSSTNTLIINSPTFQTMSNDVYIDDVSLIEMELPAYAGPDKWFLPGDSVYIGRESDVEIDESCIWYQMTSPTTSISIDTIAGLYVKPVATTTYVVRQQLWCSGVKWDTVIVSLSGVGFTEMVELQNNITLFPNPASDFIHVQYSYDFTYPFNALSVYDNLGQIVLQEEINFRNQNANITISKLDNGIYYLELSNAFGQIIRKRFAVSR